MWKLIQHSFLRLKLKSAFFLLNHSLQSSQLVDKPFLVTGLYIEGCAWLQTRERAQVRFSNEGENGSKRQVHKLTRTLNYSLSFSSWQIAKCFAFPNPSIILFSSQLSTQIPPSDNLSRNGVLCNLNHIGTFELKITVNNTHEEIKDDNYSQIKIVIFQYSTISSSILKDCWWGFFIQ